MSGMRAGRQDMVQALVLAEGVYKAADVGEAAAVQIMDTMQRDLPEHLCRLETVQWSQPQGPQRYSNGFIASVAQCSMTGQF